MGWPENYPRHHNACQDPCDMWEGPCVCGATHMPGEFSLGADRELYRNGKLVVTYVTYTAPICGCPSCNFAEYGGSK